MDTDIINRLDKQDKKLDEIYRSVNKTRRYLFWMLVISISVIILPLIGYAILIPRLISIYSGLGTL
jgi:hypothetical protein